MTSPSTSAATPKIHRRLLPTKAKWRCLMPSDITYINKYKPKMVRSVELSQLNYDQTKNKSFRELRKTLADNKTASSLRIHDQKYKHFSQVAHHISSLLNSSNHYKKLDFNCFDNISRLQFASQNVVRSLARLGRCKDLQHLKIKFSCREETKNGIINRLSSQLIGLKKLKTLDLDTFSLFGGASKQDDPNEALFKLKYPRCLSSLALNFKASNSVKEGLLPTFIANLQRCNQLKSLNLGMGSIPGDTLTAKYLILAPLFKNLANSLEALKLEAKFAEGNMNAFLEDFSHLKNLTALDLLISSDLSQDQFRLFISTLYNHLASFPNFKSLNLRVLSRLGAPFAFNRFTYNPDASVTKVLPIEFHLVFPPLQSLTKLEELKIDFPGHADLDHSHLQSLAQALQHLHCLKKLNLEFSSPKIPPEGISSLTQSFKNLHSLKDLRLMMSGIKLQSQSVEVVLTSLANLPLENLNLNLGQTKSLEEAMLGFVPNFNLAGLSMNLGMPIDPNQMMNLIPPRSLCEDQTTISAILSALSSLNLLKHLKLNLSVFKLSTQQAEQLYNALSKLKQLSSLNLDLPEFEDLKSPLSSLKEMPKLSSLAVAFPRGKIGDEEVRHLASHLQSCQSLQVLNLRFEEADQLTEDSIIYFSRGIKGLMPLRELDLTFGRKQEFREEAVFGFIESLTAIKGLEKLNFGCLPMGANPKTYAFIKKQIEQSKWRSFVDVPMDTGASRGFISFGFPAF